MKRTLFIFSLVLGSVLSVRLSAQTEVQPSTPSTMSSAYGEKLRIAGVPNSGKINDHLFRGAQPRDTGLLALKKLGITTIVDLRAEDPSKATWEEKKSGFIGNSLRSHRRQRVVSTDQRTSRAFSLHLPRQSAGASFCALSLRRRSHRRFYRQLPHGL